MKPSTVAAFGSEQRVHSAFRVDIEDDESDDGSRTRMELLDARQRELSRPPTEKKGADDLATINEARKSHA